MSNETANRSHAGLVFQAFPNDPPEIPSGSWGVEVNDVVRLTGIEGFYTVRLSRPLSNVINAAGNAVSAIDGLVLFSPVGQNPEIRVSLSPDLFGPPPPTAPGSRVQLPLILIAIFVAGVPANVTAVVNIEIRRSPED